MSISEAILRQGGERVLDWQRILLLTHERPDGDALGSIVGLSRMLNAAGKQAEAVIFGDFPVRYRGVLADDCVSHWDRSDPETLAEKYDGAIIADTSAFIQLMPAAALLESRVLPIVVVDHHITRDAVGDYEIIDETASSASVLVAEWGELMGWPIDQTAALAMFIGMATDTGWFRYSNTDPRTLSCAARMLERGFATDTLYDALFMRHTEARMRLTGRMLTGVTFHAGRRVAVATVTSDLVAECHADISDLDDLVNETMKLEQVQVSLLFVEHARNPVKVSLRSKGQIDVAAIAQSLGGGGHARAAGVRLQLPLEEARRVVVDAVLDSLG